MKRRWVSRFPSVGLVCLALGTTGCGSSGGPGGLARANTILIAITLAAGALSVLAWSIRRRDQDTDLIGS